MGDPVPARVLQRGSFEPPHQEDFWPQRASQRIWRSLIRKRERAVPPVLNRHGQRLDLSAPSCHENEKDIR